MPLRNTEIKIFWALPTFLCNIRFKKPTYRYKKVGRAFTTRSLRGAQTNRSIPNAGATL